MKRYVMVHRTTYMSPPVAYRIAVCLATLGFVWIEFDQPCLSAKEPLMKTLPQIVSATLAAAPTADDKTFAITGTTKSWTTSARLAASVSGRFSSSYRSNWRSSTGQRCHAISRSISACWTIN